ncbi:MAG: hypothetical protein IKJ30_07170 [Bacilli bacterium]|nr:hypothetical protein [Bacilli bacterium]
MDMRQEVAQFCRELDVEVPKYRDGVIDPDAKSVHSLQDKVYRNVVKLENPDYTLKNINDMIRCTITVDNYAQIPQLLRNLKEQIPSLTGYISECENGYRGIHLNFTIDGFNAEIQIHTPEVAFTNQATEAIYTRWRSFDEQAKLEELAGKRMSARRYAKKAEEIRQDGLRAAREYEACQTLYGKQNSQTDFDAHSAEIRGVLDSFSYEMRGTPKEKLPDEVDAVLSVKPHNGKTLDKRLLKKQAKFLNAQARIRQRRLIQIATQCREHAISSNIDFEMRPIERFFMEASKCWDRVFYGKIEQVTGSKRSYNYLINRKKFSCLQKMYEYALNNNLDITNANEVMRTFFNDPNVRASINPNPTKYSEVSDVDLPRMIEFTIKEEIKAKHREVKQTPEQTKKVTTQPQPVTQVIYTNPVAKPKKKAQSTGR